MKLKISVFDTEDGAQNPAPDQVVLGYDEIDKKWREVRYRDDSNRFFDHPYTGAIYPYARMNKWKPIESQK